MLPLLQAFLAVSLAAQPAATASLDAVAGSPAAPVAGPLSPAPMPPPEMTPEPELRELAPPPAPSPFQEAQKLVQAQLKLIEAKGRSLSKGLAFRRGSLRNPAQLPAVGLGFRALRSYRNSYYGTDDLIGGLIQLSAELKQADPDMPPLAVGDLSGPRGGRIAIHRSHRNGRDADLGFFWTDEDGRPVALDEFTRVDRRGRARHHGKKVIFDVRRNWALVRALLTSPRFGDRVRWIFVYAPLRRLLLDYAEREEGDLYVIEKAWRSLQQPGNRAGRHDNHFHVRIDCSSQELADGCKNDR